MWCDAHFQLILQQVPVFIATRLVNFNSSYKNKPKLVIVADRIAAIPGICGYEFVTTHINYDQTATWNADLFHLIEPALFAPPLKKMVKMQTAVITLYDKNWI